MLSDKHYSIEGVCRTNVQESLKKMHGPKCRCTDGEEITLKKTDGAENVYRSNTPASIYDTTNT